MPPACNSTDSPPCIQCPAHLLPEHWPGGLSMLDMVAQLPLPAEVAVGLDGVCWFVGSARHGRRRAAKGMHGAFAQDCACCSRMTPR